MPSLQEFTGTLGRKLASHLLRRTTFGPTKQQIDQFAAMTPSAALTTLFTAVTPPAPPIDLKTNAAWNSPKPGDANSGEEDLRRYFMSWYIEQMRASGTNAIEKFTFFLHTHFTAIQSVIDKSTALYYQNVMFRHFALGNIKALAELMCIDNAMLIMLDGRLNDKNDPNENFAREFFELFTIGKGKEIGPGNYTNYTEDDIKEAAKVFSGWENDRDFMLMETIPGGPQVAVGILKGNSNVAERHDASTKAFSSAFGGKIIKPTEMIGDKASSVAARQEIKDIVEMVFEQPETARHICRKIYRHFVYYKITDAVELDIIQPLANILIANDYELKPVYEALFKSQHFYDFDTAEKEDDNIGALIKSPLELTLGILRFFKVDFPPTSNLESFYESYWFILQYLNDQGLDFYEPTDVAGYDAYHQSPVFNRNWISSNTLAQRYSFSKRAISGLHGEDPIGFKIDILQYVRGGGVSNPADSVTVVTELLNYMLPQDITPERFNYFLYILVDATPNTVKNEPPVDLEQQKMNWTTAWNNSEDDVLRDQLELLIASIMQSPEFQLF